VQFSVIIQLSWPGAKYSTNITEHSPLQRTIHATCKRFFAQSAGASMAVIIHYTYMTYQLRTTPRSRSAVKTSYAHSLKRGCICSAHVFVRAHANSPGEKLHHYLDAKDIMRRRDRFALVLSEKQLSGVTLTNTQTTCNF
jgi:hypothetical protein